MTPDEMELIRSTIETLTEGLRLASETQRKQTECIRLLNDRLRALEDLIAVPPPEIPRRRIFGGPRIHGI